MDWSLHHDQDEQQGQAPCRSSTCRATEADHHGTLGFLQCLQAIMQKVSVYVSLLQMYCVRTSVHDSVRSYIAEKHNLVFGLTWPRRLTIFINKQPFSVKELQLAFI